MLTGTPSSPFSGIDIEYIDKPLPAASPLAYQEPVYLGQNLYIRPSYIVSRAEWAGGSFVRSVAQREAECNLKENAHNGVLSSKAIGGLRNAINWLCLSAQNKWVERKADGFRFKFKVNFITLTLPDSSVIVNTVMLQKKLLNPFLTLLRTRYGLNNYVWKIEFQENGKLHVHFTTDSFIHLGVLRRLWNNLLTANGIMVDYVLKYSGCTFREYCALKCPLDRRNLFQMRKGWRHGVTTNWRDPNTTDVHSVRKVKDLAAYMCKYMAKQDAQLSKVKGRIWGCSQALSRANKTKVFVCRNELSQVVPVLFDNQVPYKAIGNIDPVTGKFRMAAEIFFLTSHDWRGHLGPTFQSAFESSLADIRGPALFQPPVYYV